MGGSNMTGGYMGNVPPGAPSGISSNPVLAQTEPKGALNHFCQRYCRRPVTKEDIVYTSAKYGKVYQATVTLNCIEGQQFVGEVAPVLKDAEKNAAQQALIHFEPCVDQLPPLAGSKNKKRKTPSAPSVAIGSLEAKVELGGDEPAAKKAMLAGGIASPSENPALTPKVLLNTICMKLLKRPMQKGEVLYETHNTARGFQSTVRLPCLPGEMGELAWAGEVASQQKMAEQNAAAQALEAVNQNLDNLQAQLPVAPRKDSGSAKGSFKGGWGKGKGKGKSSWYGKGGDYDWGGWGGFGPGPGCYYGGYGSGYGPGPGGYCDDGFGVYEGGCEGYEGYGGDMDGAGMGMGMGCMGGMCGMGNMSGMDGMGSMGTGGKGKKGGKAGLKREEESPERRQRPPPSVPRKRVTKVAITGEVLEWRGRYGWLKTHAEIQHPAAKKHGGKLFASKSDFADPTLQLEEGTVLQFHVYEDPNGLGAEDIQAF